MDLGKPFEIFTQPAFLAGVGGAVAENLIEKIAFSSFRPTYGYANETRGGSVVVADTPGSTVPSQQRFINRQVSRLAATSAVMYLAGASGTPGAVQAAIGFGVVAVAHVVQDLFPAQLLMPARK